VEVAGREVDRIAGGEAHVVEEERRGHARVAGIPGLQPANPHRLGTVAAFARGDRSIRRQTSAVQGGERAAGSVGAHDPRQLGRTELLEQRERGCRRPHAAERLEVRERAEQLGLGGVVGEHATGEPVACLVGRRVCLQ
jgi:hypothetical protein